MDNHQEKIDRRGFVADGIRLLGVIGIAGAGGVLALRKGKQGPLAWQDEQYVWQLDPDKCMACGNCQTECVLDVSAVKAVNCFALCGYCDVCTGYFPTNEKNYKLETGAENQLCPTGAIVRGYIEEQGGQRRFKYTIDESLCIACGKCVVGCKLMNGSLYLQVRYDRCLHCNECSIAISCPTQAFRRVPAAAPNLLKESARKAEEAMAQKRAKRAARGKHVEKGTGEA
jgi:Na+-translocating ferredoxin:NAD+ oxidoreductase subunit B